jgi:oligosaccharide repeat unit polymerase
MVKIDIFRPYFLTSTLLFLYSFAGILYITEFELTYYGEFVSMRLFVIFIFATLATQLGISIGFAIQSSRSHNISRPSPDVIYNHSDSMASKCLLVVTALAAGACLPFIYESFLPSAAVGYQDWALQSRVEDLRSNTSGLKEIFTETLPIVLIICSSIHLLFTPNYFLVVRILAATALALFLYTQLLSGARAQIIMVLLLLGIFINYRIYRFNFLQIFLGSASVYVLVNLISILRFTSDPLEMIYALQDQLSAEGLQFLAISSSTELLTSLNAVRVIESIESGQETFQHGMLFVNQILGFIPKAIWPGRPFFASELFVQTFYPGIFQSGGGFGFSIVAEGYWDFGLIGCVICGMLIGGFGEKIYQLFFKHIDNDLYIFLYSLIFLRLVILLNRSGFISSIKASFIVSIPILLVLLVYYFIELARKAK